MYVELDSIQLLMGPQSRPLRKNVLGANSGIEPSFWETHSNGSACRAAVTTLHWNRLTEPSSFTCTRSAMTAAGSLRHGLTYLAIMS
jgi:hypothetical protein